MASRKIDFACVRQKNSEADKAAHYREIPSKDYAIPAWLSEPVNPKAVGVFLHGGPYFYVDQEFAEQKVTQWGGDCVWCFPNLPGSTSFGDRGVEQLDDVWLNRGWQDDMQAIVNYLKSLWPTLPVILVGQSWGAYVALRAASVGMGDGWAALQPMLDLADQAAHATAKHDVLLNVLGIEHLDDIRLRRWKIDWSGLLDKRPAIICMADNDEVIDPEKVSERGDWLLEKKQGNLIFHVQKNCMHKVHDETVAQNISMQLQDLIKKVVLCHGQ